MKAFGTRIYTALLFIVFLLCCGGLASAELIGLSPTFPDVFANSQGTYSYDASDQRFTINAQPNKLSYNAIDYDYIGPSPSQGHYYTVSINVDNSGNFISNGNDNTLIAAGRNIDPYGGLPATVYDGILLEGNITDFGWGDPSDTGNGQYQIFDFTFNIIGGELISLFGSHGGAIAVSEASGFDVSAGWEEDFEGTFVKVDNFPVPVPAAVLLLGSGLMGLAGLKIKRSSKK